MEPSSSSFTSWKFASRVWRIISPRKSNVGNWLDGLDDACGSSGIMKYGPKQTIMHARAKNQKD